MPVTVPATVILAYIHEIQLPAAIMH